MSLLEQKTNRKERVDKKVTELDFKADNSKKYEVEIIWDSAVYANKVKSYLPGQYYLVAWKIYPEEENTWEPSSAVQHLKKLVNFFYKKHSKKPTATFLPIESALLMARLTVKFIRPTTKQKQGRLANNTNKWARNWVLNACDIWTIFLL